MSYKILHEPLVHFLLFTLLLFLLDDLFSAIQKEKIVIDTQTAQYLVTQRESLELRKLLPEEKPETIDTYIVDEILYSEAYKRGLDKGDSRMRKNMILKMRGFLTDEIEPPTEQQLRDYFASKRADYTYPAKWSLQHVFFSDPTLIPDDLLGKLNSGLDPSNLGDFRPGMGRALPRRSKTELAGLFGTEATLSILDIQNDQWHGPFESLRGEHFVRITGREPTRDADFEQIKTYLERDWEMLQAGKVIQKKTR